MFKIISDTRAQIWGMDLVVAVIIFSIGLTGFYLYSLNEQGSSQEIVELLSYDGRIISEIILSEGYPENWDTSNVVEIGILKNNKIDETKLENFYNLASTNYTRTKHLFNTIYDYYFFLDENMTINSLEVEGIGKPGINKDNINAKDLVKITRVVVYQNKIMTSQLYLWK